MNYPDAACMQRMIQGMTDTKDEPQYDEARCRK